MLIIMTMMVAIAIIPPGDYRSQQMPAFLVLAMCSCRCALGRKACRRSGPETAGRVGVLGSQRPQVQDFLSSAEPNPLRVQAVRSTCPGPTVMRPARSAKR